jgi:hypothetical protein
LNPTQGVRMLIHEQCDMQEGPFPYGFG